MATFSANEILLFGGLGEKDGVILDCVEMKFEKILENNGFEFLSYSNQTIQTAPGKVGALVLTSHWTDDAKLTSYERRQNNLTVINPYDF